jgi:hypothetical protein
MILEHVFIIYLKSQAEWSNAIDVLDEPKYPCSSIQVALTVDFDTSKNFTTTGI